MSLFDIIGQGASIGGDLYSMSEGISRARGVGEQALARAEQAGEQIKEAVQFKPFTVTSGIGGATATPEGGFTYALSPEQQAIQERMQGFGAGAFDFLSSPEARAQEQSNLIGMLTQDPNQRASREQEMYNRLRAVQQPEEARKQLELEERLFNQGRGGVQTAMYGGTPEQLAQAKAIEEAKALASLGAIEQAGTEQYRQSEQTLAGLGETRQRMGLFGELGLGSLQASYLPQQTLLDFTTPSLDLANITGAGQRQYAQNLASMLQFGLGERTNAEQIASNLEQSRLNAITNLLTGQRDETGATTQTGLIEGLLRNVFGG